MVFLQASGSWGSPWLPIMISKTVISMGTIKIAQLVILSSIFGNGEWKHSNFEQMLVNEHFDSKWQWFQIVTEAIFFLTNMIVHYDLWQWLWGMSPCYVSIIINMQSMSPPWGSTEIILNNKIGIIIILVEAGVVVTWGIYQSSLVIWSGGTAWSRSEMYLFATASSRSLARCSCLVITKALMNEEKAWGPRQESALRR